MLQGVSYEPKQIKNAVVLLHGYGADGADLIELSHFWRALLPNTAFFAPNAPTMLPFGGFEWFSLDDYNPQAAASAQYALQLNNRAQKNVPLVIDYLNMICQKYTLSLDKMVLGGFSQGGLMSFLSAYQLPSPLAGVIGMSAVPLVAPVQTTLQTPVLLTHGTSDEVVPFAAMNLSKQTLLQMNQQLQTFSVQGMGHNIDMHCVEEAARFLSHVLK